MISNRPRAHVQILVKQKYRAIIKYNYSCIQLVSILLNRCYLNLLSKPYVAARIMSHYVFLNFIIFFLFFTGLLIGNSTYSDVTTVRI